MSEQQNTNKLGKTILELKNMAKKVMCPYCGKTASLVTGDKIYPHRPDLYHLKFYHCDNGHVPAFVGCHKGTINPLGTLANADLRRHRSQAHAVFDALWKTKKMTRAQSYQWLAHTLAIDKKDCHIAMFDVDLCRNTIDVASKKMIELGS